MTDTKISTDNETRALIEAMQLVEDAGYVVLHPNSPALASRHQEPVNEPGEWQAELVALEKYADEKTAVAFSQMMEARRDGDSISAAVMEKERDAYSDMTKRLRTLRAASLPKVERGVKIKPLEWDENGDAKTALATYHVEKGMFGWQWSCFSGAGGYAGAKPLGSKEEAKAAAQADYEQRIRSALKVSPSTSEGEAVAYTDPRAISALRGTPAQKVYLTKTPSPAYSMPLYAAPQPSTVVTDAAFDNHQWPLGLRVTKTKGAAWTGRIVGYYSTALTPVGYAVESENEPGSVQIYPVSALQQTKQEG